SVPSIGSTTQSRSDPARPLRALSSARMGMCASWAERRAMMAVSAAWSAAVAKFARPRLRVTIAVSLIAMASPTATAVSEARRASSAKRARSRGLVLLSGIGRAEYPDLSQQIVQVERLGDHILEIGRHTSELQLRGQLVCRLLLEKK